MNDDMLKKALALLSSSSETDALMALRGLRELFQERGVTLDQALLYALAHADKIAARKAVTIDVDEVKTSVSDTVVAAGMPACRALRAGCVEIVTPGNASGELIQLQGLAAEQAEDIALHLKDALVAAVINKTRFKLKLFDVKNSRGEVVETALQAEYERQGMTPIRIWVNVRGEVATLATLLRRAVANACPELMAS